MASRMVRRVTSCGTPSAETVGARLAGPSARKGKDRYPGDSDPKRALLSRRV